MSITGRSRRFLRRTSTLSPLSTTAAAASAISGHHHDEPPQEPQPPFVTTSSLFTCPRKLRNLSIAQAHLAGLIKIRPSPSPRAFAALICAFCAGNEPLDAYRLFSWMCTSSRRSLDASLYNAIIPALWFNGQVDCARQVLDVMLYWGIRPTVTLYKLLACGLCEKDRNFEAERLIAEMGSHGLSTDFSMYASMVQRYCAAGEMDSTLRLFNQIGPDRDASLYSRLIEGFLNCDKFDEARELFSEMIDRGLSPEGLLCRSMIRWPCRNQEVDWAKELLDMMVRHGLLEDERCYMILIPALCRANKLEDSMRWFDKMLEVGIFPAYKSFVLLIKSHPKEQKRNIVCKILEAMSKKCDLSSDDAELIIEKIAGCKAVSVSSAINILIHYFCLEGKINNAIIFMDKLVDCGLETSMFTFNTIFKCMCKIGGITNLERALDHLEKWNVVPNESTYLILIDSCCKQGNIHSALKLYEHMRERELRPTVAIYDSIIGCLCRKRRMGKAMEMFRMMFEYGIKPDEVIYATLLSCFSKMEMAFDACTLFGVMIKHRVHPSFHAYSAIINVLIWRNRFRMARMCLSDMQSKEFVPDTVFYTMLIKQFARKSAKGFAFNLYDLMIREQIEPNIYTVTSMISGICRGFREPPLSGEELQEANKFVDMLPQNTAMGVRIRRNFSRSVESKIEEAFDTLRGINQVDQHGTVQLVLDVYYCNGRINFSCVTGDMDNALNHFVSMIDGVLPNHVTYTTLIGGYMRSGNIGFAIDFLNLMNRQGFLPDRVAYVTIIGGLCTARRGDDALYFIQMMQKRGYLPGKNLYDKVIECSCHSCSDDLSLKLLEEMLTHKYVPRLRIKLLMDLLGENKLWEVLHKHGRMLDEETNKELAEMCCSNKELDLGSENEEKMVVYGN